MGWSGSHLPEWGGIIAGRQVQCAHHHPGAGALPGICPGLGTMEVPPGRTPHRKHSGYGCGGGSI